MTAAGLGRLMLAFDGLELPEPMHRRLADAPAAGVTLFRYRNVESPAQVRDLTDAIQSLAPDGAPFLVAIDQEGGQLLGLGSGATPFPGNMALGAADDPDLTRRVAEAIGRELRAVGVNVNYAPVADLATNPANPSLGVRSFGDEPSRVAAHAASFVGGLERAGVAATLKHFPGKGDVGVDTHHHGARLSRPASAFAVRELVPFRAGIDAGASLVMTGHVAVPGLSGDERPATLSPAIVEDLLRGSLGFGGVSISDAFDMDALSPGGERVRDAMAALDAGLDLILLGSRSDRPAFDAALATRVDGDARDRSALDRVDRLRRRLGAAVTRPPSLSVVGSDAHRSIADEVAWRALTLARDEGGLLPLRPADDDELLVIMPRPEDRTPADTSAAVRPALAVALRRHHPRVAELLVSPRPTRDEVGAAADRARQAACVVIGTVSASLEPSQAGLVRGVLAAGPPVVTVALRTPWDLAGYPAAGTHVLTYSILEPSMRALADGLFGRAGFPGRLPVREAVPA